ncbi:MAG: L-rhamnose mutarotase [Acidobacteria bacterium]|nr:L-rhamnose mutarotase [Acidobacteriota bacterium]
MQRVAFQLRIKADMIEQYDDLHRHVWPEMIESLEKMGVREYSIFRRGQDLFLTLRCPDFDALIEQMKHSDVDRRWQRMMASYWEPVPGQRDDEPFAMMKEVFYMAGKQEE